MAATTEIALVPGQRAARRILAVIATGVDLFDRLHEAQEFAGSVIEFGGYATARLLKSRAGQPILEL